MISNKKIQSQYREYIQPSKVLLINLFNYENDIVTHDSYYQMFSRFGKVQKILIFEKAKIQKTFVEMDSIESAKSAIDNLKGDEMIGESSKFEVYFAKYKYLKIDKNKNSGIDYDELQSQLEKKYNAKCLNKVQSKDSNEISDYDRSEYSEQESLNNIHKFDTQFQKREQKAMSNYEKQFRDSLRQLDEQMNSMQFIASMSTNYQDNNKIQSQQEFNKVTDYQSRFHNDYQQESRKTINSEQIIKEEMYQNKKEKERTREKVFQQMEIIKQQKTQQFLEQNRKSPVIYIKDLDLDVINGQMIFNLFSNYGYIKQIQMFLRKRSVLIEYQNVLFASQAKDYLSYKTWFKCRLKIYYSRYFSLDSRENVNLQEEVTYIPMNQFQSFKEQKIYFNEFMQIKGINIPSETLHVTNISIHVNLNTLVGLFQQYGQIVNVEYFYYQYPSYKVSKKGQILKLFIRYCLLEDSLKAISCLNNMAIYERHLIIQFTKTRI